MARKLHQMQTSRLKDPDAEEARRDMYEAILELQGEVRKLVDASNQRCVGIAHYQLSANQGITATSETIDFDTEVVNTVPSLVTSNEDGRFRLQPGYTYRFLAAIYCAGTGEELTVQWRNVTDAAYIGTQGYTPVIDTAVALGPQPTAAAAVKPGKQIAVELWTETIVGTPLVGYELSWASIEVYAG